MDTDGGTSLENGGCLTALSGTLARTWESKDIRPSTMSPKVIIEDNETAVKTHDQTLSKAQEKYP
jgi:hypothetical protein